MQSDDGVTATVKPQQIASGIQLQGGVSSGGSLRQVQKAAMGMSRLLQEAASSQLQECNTVKVSAVILTGNARPEQVAAALQQSERKAAQMPDAAFRLALKSADEIAGSELHRPHATDAISAALPGTAKSQPGPEGKELPGLIAAALPCEALQGEGMSAQNAASNSQPDPSASEASAIALSGLPESTRGAEGCQSPSLRAAAPPCKAPQGDDVSAQGTAGPAACPLPGLDAALTSPQIGPADAADFSMTVQQTEALGKELCAKVSSTEAEPYVRS